MLKRCWRRREGYIDGDSDSDGDGDRDSESGEEF